MDTGVIVSVIAAVADNGVIGHQGKIPWNLPSDLAAFARITKGEDLDHKPMVVMGRRTWESLPQSFRPLPGRLNVVLTGNRLYQTPGCLVVFSWEEVLLMAYNYARARMKAEEIFVAGGAKLYQLALPRAQKLYLTRVHLSPAGDTCFPQWDIEQWQLDSSERHSAQSGDDCDCTFEVWRRKNNPVEEEREGDE